MFLQSNTFPGILHSQVECGGGQGFGRSHLSDRGPQNDSAKREALVGLRQRKERRLPGEELSSKSHRTTAALTLVSLNRYGSSFCCKQVIQKDKVRVSTEFLRFPVFFSLG